MNDVKVGGSKYGIISLHGLKTPTLRVHMHENLYFTNRKVLCPSLQPYSPLCLCTQGIAVVSQIQGWGENFVKKAAPVYLVFPRGKWNFRS